MEVRGVYNRRLTIAASSLCLVLGLAGCNQDSTPTATTTVAGVVNDTVGIPVAGATVSAVSSTSAAVAAQSVPAGAVTTTTSADGSFSIEVPDGNVQVAVSKDGFDGGGFHRGPGGQQRGVNFDLEPRVDPMTRMDTDGDGVISKAEWKGPPDAFLKIDTDSSGTITKAELDAAKKDMIANHPRHGPMDTNGDGLISRSEWLGPPAAFDEIDTDKDGSLSKTEMQTAMANRRPPGGGFR